LIYFPFYNKYKKFIIKKNSVVENYENFDYYDYHMRHSAARAL